jgi:hypothetical protein
MIRPGMALHRPFSALAASLALVGAPMHARAEAPASAATTAGDAPLRAELVIEADLGEDASTVLVDRIRVRGEALLRQREVLPARGDGDPKIRIRVETLGDAIGYRCHFGAYDRDGVIAGSDGVSLCKLCTEAELVDHVEAAIDRVVPELPTPGGVDVPPPRVEPAAPKRSAPLATVGKAGLGVLIAGVAIGIAGAVVISRPTEVKDTDLVLERTSYRKPGIAVLSVGLAALLVGGALLVVDRVRARRRGGATALRGAAFVPIARAQ